MANSKLETQSNLARRTIIAGRAGACKKLVHVRIKDEYSHGAVEIVHLCTTYQSPLPVAEDEPAGQ